MRSILLVQTNCEPGKEAEFNEWYQEVHLKEVCEVDGIVAAQRYALTDDQMGPGERPFQFLAIYEVEGDPAVAFKNLLAAAPGMNMTPTLVENHTAHFSPIGDRVGT